MMTTHDYTVYGTRKIFLCKIVPRNIAPYPNPNPNSNPDAGGGMYWGQSSGGNVTRAILPVTEECIKYNF